MIYLPFTLTYLDIVRSTNKYDIFLEFIDLFCTLEIINISA